VAQTNTAAQANATAHDNHDNASVFRIYVEKKPGFDVEAQQLRSELVTILGITGITGLRMINRYDVQGIDAALFDQAVATVFSEPQVDTVSETLPGIDNKAGDNTAAGAASNAIFGVEYLPGQFDQRADSASECIQLISQGERPTVRTARIYIIAGDLSPEDLAAVKRYVINPVESRPASLDPVTSLNDEVKQPGSVEILRGFNELDEQGLGDFLVDRALAMDLADAQCCQRYFAGEKREPTITEIKVIDTYWSDHCRHTTFGTRLDDIAFDDDKVSEAFNRYLAMRKELGRDAKPICLMDMATIGAKWLATKGLLTGLDESEEINACTVKVKVDVDGRDEDWLFLFKNETHNHPTEIEPFGGAATCIGGCIRDPLSGRSYVYQAMRVTGAGDPTVPGERDIAGQAPPAQAGDRSRRRILLVRQSDWPGHRAGERNLPPRATWPSAWRSVPWWAPRQPIMCAAKPRLRATRSFCWAGAPAVTASAGPQALRSLWMSPRPPSSAPKCRRATRLSSASCSGSSAARTPVSSSSAATISAQAACRWRPARSPTG
jgi:phosphoribosylformylglycinamidine synthase